VGENSDEDEVFKGTDVEFGATFRFGDFGLGDAEQFGNSFLSEAASFAELSGRRHFLPLP